MKILPVTSLKMTSSPVLEQENKKTLELKLNRTSMPSAFLGYDLVSFGARRFYDTLKDNYFKLKEGYKPDKFQIQAGQFLNDDKSVLVSAPTGTGKTAIAQYAVSKNMHEGKKTFYTTPLKALSNQKFREFQEVWGKENVGILTGDRKENPDAPILIMTTEVFRNMAMSKHFGQRADLMDNLGTVIFDEFHYLADPSRGPVWEESVIFTPENVQTLALSATVGNPEQLTDWLNTFSDKKCELVYVPSENRHVPLEFKTFQTANLNNQKQMLEKKYNSPKTKEMLKNTVQDYPEFLDFKNLTSLLKRKEQLPAIYFVFNRRSSFDLVSYLSKYGEELTSDDEKNQIREIMTKYKAENFSSLDTKALMNGYAVHNAGILPDQKAMVEELFQKKLVKVVVATETLGAGINMPAKTVVISQCTKPSDTPQEEDKPELPYNRSNRNSRNTNEQNGSKKSVYKRNLTANEFHQMAGRAGRRGIDTVGYVYVMPSSIKTEMVFNDLIKASPDPITSKLNPDYAFISNVYDYAQDPQVLKEILNKSFYAHTSSTDASQIFEDAMKKTALMVKRGFLTKNNDKSYELTDKGRLLSVIKGYSQLPLAEAVYDKAFDGLTPAALASVVGAMANPADSKEGAYSINPQNRQQNSSKLQTGISELYQRMQATLKDKLSYVGDKRYEDFKNVHEIVEYLDTIETPVEDLDEIKQKCEKYLSVLNKLDRLHEQYSSWSIQKVAKMLQEGKTVSLEAMSGCYKKVQETIKKYQGREQMEHKQEKLQKRLISLDYASKTGKEKRKYRLEAEDLEYEIKLIDSLKYLDDHLPSVMSAADRFVKANNYGATRKLAEKYSRLYDTALNLHNLKVAAKGCEQLEDYFKNHDVKSEDEINKSMTSSVMNKLLETTAKIYSDGVSVGITNRPQGYGNTSMQLVYNFAELNKINPDSMSNWQQILSDLPFINESFDEGQFFRSVTQSIDLLSQISEMATVGKDFAQTADDKRYYSELKQNTTDAIKLLNKYPVVFN